MHFVEGFQMANFSFPMVKRFDIFYLGEVNVGLKVEFQECTRLQPGCHMSAAAD